MEYLPRLSSKYEIPLDLVQLQWTLLPVKIHDVESYRHHLEAARRRLEARDPDDAHPLALANALSPPCGRTTQISRASAWSAIRRPVC